MVGLGLFELLGIVRSAGHLKKDGANAIDGADIFVIDGENFLEFIDSLGAEAHVLFGGSAGNVLAGIVGGQVETCVHQNMVEVLWLLKILYACFLLSVLVNPFTLIEVIA